MNNQTEIQNQKEMSPCFYVDHGMNRSGFFVDMYGQCTVEVMKKI